MDARQVFSVQIRCFLLALPPECQAFRSSYFEMQCVKLILTKGVGILYIEIYKRYKTNIGIYVYIWCSVAHPPPPCGWVMVPPPPLWLWGCGGALLVSDAADFLWFLVPPPPPVDVWMGHGGGGGAGSMYIYKYLCVYEYIYMYMYMMKWICTYNHMCIYVYIYTYVIMFMNMYAYGYVSSPPPLWCG